MLTGEQLAGLIVAMFWAILVSFLAYGILCTVETGNCVTCLKKASTDT